MRWIQNGSQDAATHLYLRYAERLRLLVSSQSSPELALREDAEDIVQSVFSSFFRGVGKGYYDVPAGDELWKLFLVIALNKICAKGAYHRAAKRDVRLTASGVLLDRCCAAPADSNDTAVVFLQMVIDEALVCLPELQQRMIVLRIEGHEIADIAAQTQRSKRTVERVLQDFRKQMTEILNAGE